MTHSAHHRGQLTSICDRGGRRSTRPMVRPRIRAASFKTRPRWSTATRRWTIWSFASVRAGRCRPYPAQGRRVRRRDRIKVESL